MSLRGPQEKNYRIWSWMWVRVFYEFNEGWFDIRYVCETVNPNASKDRNERRIKRIRQITDENQNGELVDVCFPKVWGNGTDQFNFKATDLAYVKSLTYNL